MSDWKPEGYNSVSAYLMCDDPDAVIALLHAVFAAPVLRRYERPDGSLMHAEIRIDDTVVMIAQGGPEWSYKAHLHVYVSDVDAVYRKALDHGAVAVQAPERKSPDDDRRGGFRDMCGNTWWIATQ
ncbi:VOC family protein [Rhizobium sp. L1K21]|uniref:VOC family protein n=1 Tax=Rhizobium sp. L1K21 TaxID=2954933 RepID=UPI0020922755|nr:VOC family protein [Rhizobium sp. L1K21]MCO6186471.1 VOC family protein [Rhizobium sp. L1K21]